MSEENEECDCLVCRVEAMLTYGENLGLDASTAFIALVTAHTRVYGGPDAVMVVGAPDPDDDPNKIIH